LPRGVNFNLYYLDNGAARLKGAEDEALRWYLLKIRYFAVV
jgi:hypothetical protein